MSLARVILPVLPDLGYCVPELETVELRKYSCLNWEVYIVFFSVWPNSALDTDIVASRLLEAEPLFS
jgi:hypothetical protein